MADKNDILLAVYERKLDDLRSRKNFDFGLVSAYVTLNFAASSFIVSNSIATTSKLGIFLLFTIVALMVTALLILNLRRLKHVAKEIENVCAALRLREMGAYADGLVIEFPQKHISWLVPYLICVWAIYIAQGLIIYHRV